MFYVENETIFITTRGWVVVFLLSTLFIVVMEAMTSSPVGSNFVP